MEMENSTSEADTLTDVLVAHHAFDTYLASRLHGTNDEINHYILFQTPRNHGAVLLRETRQRDGFINERGQFVATLDLYICPGVTEPAKRELLREEGDRLCRLVNADATYAATAATIPPTPYRALYLPILIVGPAQVPSLRTMAIGACITHLDPHDSVSKMPRDLADLFLTSKWSCHDAWSRAAKETQQGQCVVRDDAHNACSFQSSMPATE